MTSARAPVAESARPAFSTALLPAERRDRSQLIWSADLHYEGIERATATSRRSAMAAWQPGCVVQCCTLGLRSERRQKPVPQLYAIGLRSHRRTGAIVAVAPFYTLVMQIRDQMSWEHRGARPGRSAVENAVARLSADRRPR